MGKFIIDSIILVLKPVFIACLAVLELLAMLALILVLGALIIPLSPIILLEWLCDRHARNKFIDQTKLKKYEQVMNDVLERSDREFLSEPDEPEEELVYYKVHPGGVRNHVECDYFFKKVHLVQILSENRDKELYVSYIGGNGVTKFFAQGKIEKIEAGNDINDPPKFLLRTKNGGAYLIRFTWVESIYVCSEV